MTLQAGRRSVGFTVRTQGDTAAEADGPVTAALASGAGYALGSPTSASVTVEDDDRLEPGVTVSKSAIALTEGGTAGTYTVAVTAPPGTGETVTVTATVADTTAARVRTGSGSPGASAVLSFTAGNWSNAQTVTVSPRDDADTTNESTQITHAVSGPGSWGSVTATAVTVTDDDPAPLPVVSIAAEFGGEGAEGTEASFVVEADPAPAANLSVKVTVADAPGADYIAQSREGTRTVAIQAGGTQVMLRIPTQADSKDDANGAVTATLVAGSGYVLHADERTAGSGIYDDATTVVLSGPAGDIAEADGVKTFTVTLGRALVEGEALEVPLVFDGTATRGEDYTVTCASAKGLTCSGLGGASPLAAFTGGAGAKAVTTLTLASVDDPTDEGEGETVTVALGTLDADSGAGLGGGASGSGDFAFTITDDDLPPPVVTIAATPASMDEGGTATFTVSADRALDADLAVAVTVADAPGADYIAQAQEGLRTVTIPDGQSTAAFTLRTPDDAADEPNGPVTATLGEGYTLGSLAQASVTVRDDDASTLPTLTIEDAEVQESKRNMRFTVRLSAPLDRPVRFTVRFQESDPVSARASWNWRTRTFCQCAYDFLPNRFEVVIPRGETEVHRGVGIVDDAHDEDDETFEGRITWADVPIADGVAVGTIKNSDSLPAAFLARFGRTVASQAVDGIVDRLAAPRMQGFEGTFAGQALHAGGAGAETDGATVNSLQTGEALDGIVQALGGIAEAFGGGAGRYGGDVAGEDFSGRDLTGMDAGGLSMTAREILLGSRFSLTGKQDDSGGTLALWGRVAQGRFDGEERGDGTDVRLDGTVTNGMLGADYAREQWLVGLALTRSSAEGGYAAIGSGGVAPCPNPEEVLCDGAVLAGDGDVDASLTAAIPYAALQASKRLKLWGAAGYGSGEVTLKTALGGRYKADTTWTMGAAGLYGDLLAPSGLESGTGGPALALTSDALWARTSSERTRDLAAADSDVARLRLGLRGSWHMAFDHGASLIPKLETGLRYDGGDAETGFGVELGSGIAWTAPEIGLSLDLSGRTLLAHGDDALKDRGYAASLAFDPNPTTAQGLSLSLGQEFGSQATGGLDALFAPNPLEQRTSSGDTSRWTAEAAYGIPAFGGRFTGSPHIIFGLATGTRDYGLGWRLAPEGQTAPDLSFDFKATRRESDTAATEHTVGFEATMSW